MLKICLLISTVTCTLCILVHGYNYGENPAASNNLDQQGQLRNGFVKSVVVSDQKWNNGFNVQQEQQDGSYIIRQTHTRPQTPSILQRNPNFIRSESVNLRYNAPGNVLSNTGFVQTNNGDVALHNERTAQRLSLPVSSISGGLSKSSNSGVPNFSKNGPADILQKNENGAVSQPQIPNNVNGATTISLPSLSRIGRPQSYSSSSGSHRHQTLEQILQHKSADKFLGNGFIQQQLLNQKGQDNKFLSIHGKEEREINGTIEVKKNGLVNANIEEVKDGRFSVMDRQNNKVGEVNLHRDVEKHLKMTENNGVTNVELEKNSNAELNIERDINLYPKLHNDQNSQNSSHKIRLHFEQNQQSRAHVEIAKNQPQLTTPIVENNSDNINNNRFRRDLVDQ